MQLFYSKIISGSCHILSPDESKHCIKVLRLGKGDVVHITDGSGNLFETVIIDDNFKKCKLEITQTFCDFGKRKFNLHIALAPTKNLNRFEWFLEKATEIGIDSITPIICNHSERKTVNTDRFNKIITAAMKQSLKAYHPQLNDAASLNTFLDREFHAEKFIAYCNENNKNLLKDEYHQGDDVLILIGPEGDFSPEEIEKVLNMGFKPVSLGNSRLRTETAAIVACMTINLMNQ